MRLTWLAIAAGLLASFCAEAASVKSLGGKHDISTAKISHIVGTIGPATADQYDANLYRTMSIPGDRLIIIDSDGGSVEAGQRILTSMDIERRTTGTRMICYVRKMAASMAFNILTRCDVRIAAPKAKLMFHRIAYYNLRDDEERLTSLRLIQLAKELEDDDKVFALANRKAMKLSRKDYYLYADRDHIWRAGQLLKRGYLHALGVLSN